MKFPKVHSLHEIANLLNCEFVGDKDFPVHGMNEIHVVEPGDIVFVDHPKYYDKALQSAATTVLINKKVECPEAFSSFYCFYCSIGVNWIGNSNSTQYFHWKLCGYWKQLSDSFKCFNL